MDLRGLFTAVVVSSFKLNCQHSCLCFFCILLANSFAGWCLSLQRGLKHSGCFGWGPLILKQAAVWYADWMEYLRSNMNDPLVQLCWVVLFTIKIPHHGRHTKEFISLNSEDRWLLCVPASPWGSVEDRLWPSTQLAILTKAFGPDALNCWQGTTGYDSILESVWTAVQGARPSKGWLHGSHPPRPFCDFSEKIKQAQLRNKWTSVESCRTTNFSWNLIFSLIPRLNEIIWILCCNVCWVKRQSMQMTKSSHGHMDVFAVNSQGCTRSIYTGFKETTRLGQSSEEVAKHCFAFCFSDY